MDPLLIRIAWAVLPSILVAVVLYFFNKGMAARDKKEDHREELRRKESRLLLDMSMANGELGYASAMALKRGQPNGEVEAAIKAYNEAKEKYENFIRDVYAEEVSK